MGKLIIRNKYGIAPNELLNRNDISLKAKGLFSYLQSKPENWRFSKKRIAKQLKEGLTSIKSAFRELKDTKYLETVPKKSKNGKWDGYDYVLNDKPEVVKPVGAKTEPTVNPPSFSKKDPSKKDIVRKNVDIITKKTEEFIQKLKKLSIKKSRIGDLKEFASYWTEPNKSKTKIRWELERTWDTERRLNTWLNNSDKWGKNRKEEKTLNDLFDN